MPTLAQIYASANSVYDQTGVDPAIVTALAQTEWGNNVAGSVTSLGIQVPAIFGRGSSGGQVAVSNPSPGQPSAFWTYNTGAEAAAALKAYIQHQFPNAAPFLGNADAFFTAMESTNYYVPRGAGSGDPSVIQYWQSHISMAHQANINYGGQPPDYGGAGSGSGSGSSSGDTTPLTGSSGSSGGPTNDVVQGFFSGISGPIVFVASIFFLVFGLLLWKGKEVVNTTVKVGTKAAEVAGI